jgi:UDP-N-acetylglucosamine--N-acetylmuramyl-(pentapeptide) pyrophosphoryl-undecaprenol N-acetylglucosamine transferase
MKKILITGTHLTPALELIRQLQKDETIDWKIYYVGRNYNSSNQQKPSIESKIIPQKNIPFWGLNCGKLDRKYLPNTLKGLPQTFTSFFTALRIIKQIKPHLVISFGGYVSVPVIFASFINKIPCLTHEQTPTLSLTTKINSHFCKKTCLSFPLSHNNPKFVVTGNLLRHTIFNQKSELMDILKYPKNLIYITAGNQGSKIINQKIKEILPYLTKYTIIHQTGTIEINSFKKLEKKYKNYFAFDYIQDYTIGSILNNADIIISRSGANTCQEIYALNKKSILIPLPKSQQDEQSLNASWLKEKLPQSTNIIPQEKLTPQLLLEEIKKLSKIKSKPIKIIQKSNLKLLKIIHENI